MTPHLLGIYLLASPAIAAERPLEDQLEVYAPLIEHTYTDESALEDAVDAVDAPTRPEQPQPDPSTADTQVEPQAAPEVPVVFEHRAGPTADLPYSGGTRRDGLRLGALAAGELTVRQVRHYDENPQPLEEDWRRGSPEYRSGYLEGYTQEVETRQKQIKTVRGFGTATVVLILLVLIS